MNRFRHTTTCVRERLRVSRIEARRRLHALLLMLHHRLPVLADAVEEFFRAEMLQHLRVCLPAWRLYCGIAALMILRGYRRVVEETWWGSADGLLLLAFGRHLYVRMLATTEELFLVEARRRRRRSRFGGLCHDGRLGWLIHEDLEFRVLLYLTRLRWRSRGVFGLNEVE